MPFGVELPQNFGTPNAAQEAAEPVAAPEGAATDEISTEAHGTQTTGDDNVLDLDKHETFRFKGQDWTREEFEKAYLRQADYTQKTQQLSEQKKYYDNFWADFSTVRSNPDRLADFERIYPKEFVQHARTLLAKPGQSAPKAVNPNESKPNSLLDHPEFRELKESVETITTKAQKEEIARIDGWLKNQYDTLGKKYPYADAETVESRALVYAQKNGGKAVTAEYLDRSFKEHNDQVKKRMDGLYKAKITQQINAGKDARDVGTGGDIAGGAPQSDRTLKQAKERMLSDVAAGRLGAR
jgi:hypothetical protein